MKKEYHVVSKSVGERMLFTCGLNWIRGLLWANPFASLRRDVAADRRASAFFEDKFYIKETKTTTRFTGLIASSAYRLQRCQTRYG